MAWLAIVSRKSPFRRISFGGRECGRTTSSAPAPQPLPLVRFHRHTSRHDPFALRSLMQMQLKRTKNWCVFAQLAGIWTGAREIFADDNNWGRRKKRAPVKGSYEKCQQFITCPGSGMLKAFFDFCSRPRFWQRD